MIKVLELFGGIGACSEALKNIGVNYEIADYVEIDKYAVKSFNAIHNTNFEPQDICSWNKDIDVDLIMHGSPCQDFSVAGLQAGADENSGTRSSLMYETLRIVEKLNPKYVIWENVKNVLSKKHKHNFDNYIERLNKLGYTSFYKVLNAKDFGVPQNRERVFTISIRSDVLKEEYHFPEARELKIVLRDVLEDEVDQKYFLSEKSIKHYNRDFGSKGKELQLDGIASTLQAAMGTGGGNIPILKQIGTLDIKGQDCIKRVYSPDGLCPTPTTMEGGNRQPKIAYGVAMRGRYNSEGKVEQHIEMSDREIANAITTVQKDSMVLENKGKKIDTAILSKYGKKCERLTDVATTLCARDYKGFGNQAMTGVIEDNYRVRKLTPKECWRLMGFGDKSFNKAAEVNSNAQLYKQAGNSIVVNVLEAILKNLIPEKDYEQ